MYVGVHEAKSNLSRLLTQVEAGEEVIIARGGRPVARLVAISPERPHRRPGTWAGRIEMSDDFDAPLPAAMLTAWRGDAE